MAASKVFPHNLRHLFARCFYEREHDLARLADYLDNETVYDDHERGGLREGFRAGTGPKGRGNIGRKERQHGINGKIKDPSAT